MTAREMWDGLDLAVSFVNMLAEPADAAISSGDFIFVGGVYEGVWLVVAPDTRIVEAVANGVDVPAAYRLVRDDGRSVSLFRQPMEAQL